MSIFNYFQLIYYYCCRLECFINIVQKKTIDVTQKKNVDIYRNSQIKIPFIFFKYCEQIINDIFYILFEWVCGWLLVNDKGTIFSHMRTSYFLCDDNIVCFILDINVYLIYRFARSSLADVSLQLDTLPLFWDKQSFSFYTMINETTNANFILFGLPNRWSNSRTTER